MVAILARYASRFSVRALDLTVDSSMLWVGAGLALVAAALLAFVPRLPSADRSNGMNLSNGSARMTGGAARRLRAFAVTQIAASFVLWPAPPCCSKRCWRFRRSTPGLTRAACSDQRACDLLWPNRRPDRGFLQRSDAPHTPISGRRRRRSGRPDAMARGRRALGPGLQFTAEGYVRGTAEDDPRGEFRIVSPGFFAALGVPMIAGRDFNDLDRRTASRSRLSAKASRSGCSPTAMRSIAASSGRIP